MTDRAPNRFYGVDLGGPDRQHLKNRPTREGRPRLGIAVPKSDERGGETDGRG